MKEGTENKLKFKKLKRRLGLPEWQAIGLLEAIWKLTRTSAPEGDIGRFSNEDIAAAIEWDDDPDSLINNLVETGWLDADPEFRLIVHDWSDHVPKYIKGNVSKYNRVFADVAAKNRVKEVRKEAPCVSKEAPKEVRKEPPNEARNEGATKSSLVQSSQAKPSQAKPKESKDSVIGDDRITAEDFFNRWNRFVEGKTKLKKAIKLSNARRKKINTRLREAEWWPTFQAAVKLLPLLGDGWQPDIDWLIKCEENVYLLVEGKFNWRVETESSRKLAERRRVVAADEREVRIAKEKERLQEQSRKSSSIIDDILRPTNGGAENEDESSLLFGSASSSSANGAECSNIPDT